ncbi:MAG: PAS domain-containing protein [Planctomycetaceae bacterium]
MTTIAQQSTPPHAENATESESLRLLSDGLIYDGKAMTSPLEMGNHVQQKGNGERKIVEQQLRSQAMRLRSSEERLRAIFDLAPECLKLLAADGTLLEMNPAGLAMIEADTFEQVANQCINPFIVPEHRPVFEDLTRRVFLGESGTLEFEIIGLKGTRLWMETHAAPLHDEYGHVTALLAITRNITERRRGEAILRESEERLRLTTTGSNTGLWDWNLQTDDVHFSTIWKRQIGYEDHEIQNRFDEFRSRVHPDDVERVLATTTAYLAHPSPDYECEFRFRHKNGSYRWILARGSRVARSTGRALQNARLARRYYRAQTDGG